MLSHRMLLLDYMHLFRIATLLSFITATAASEDGGSYVQPNKRTISSPEKFGPYAARSRSHDYKIISNEVVYNRWRSIIQRKVKCPRGRVIDYDVVDQKGQGAVIIFAWDTKTKTATIVKEYMPGCHRILCGLAAGIVEAGKHESPLIAAQHELEEECHLNGGTWIRLTDEGISVPMDKYVVTEITAYLVLDARHVEDPRPLDEEEDIEIVRGVPASLLIQMIRGGEFNLVGGWASLLAIEKLRELGELD